jgi:23S rRNA (adenine2503-C2)-methyltransferase
MNKKILYGKTVDEISEMIGDAGFGSNYATLIANSIYKKRITDLSLVSKLPSSLRLFLSQISSTARNLPVAFDISADKTIKYLFRNSGGKQYETVFIPDNKRNTVCVSTQSGCRMGCPFCLTGRYGFHGNLSAGDIINQIIAIPGTEKVTHIVFMGMGEPLDNLENVLKACRIITSEWGFAISPRNITVSTVGITPGVETFLEQSSCNLTISLHSPFHDERLAMIPVEARYPVSEIIGIMKKFPLRKKRRFSVAYIMVDGLNDTQRHLEGLKSMLAGSEIRVNLLPYHPVCDDGHISSSGERMQYFRHNLVISGISASVRKSRGADISAACGLLASNLI